MKLSRHFALREFVPDGEVLPAPELALTEMMVLTLLEPLRAYVGRPIFINSAGRQLCGWRFEVLDVPGSAKRLSDHMVISESLGHVSCGAIDIRSRVTPLDLALAITELCDAGTSLWPREIILEERYDGESWLHVAYPETLRNLNTYKNTPGAVQSLTRSVRKHPRTDKPHRCWHMRVDRDKSVRTPVTFTKDGVVEV